MPRAPVHCTGTTDRYSVTLVHCSVATVQRHGRQAVAGLHLAAVWLAGLGLSYLFPGGSYLFIALGALLGIVLVLVVYGGDIRIT